MDTTTKFFLKALWPGIIMAAVFLIWCPLLFSIHDIEDFVLVVLFTVLQARALWDGQYPFWTPNCALGIPLPSSQHFTFHPLFPLFGLKDIKTSILIFYLFQLTIGAFSVAAIYRRLSVKKSIALLGVITYIFSATTLHYTLADFWPTHLATWTLTPLCLYFLVTAFDADKASRQAINFVLAGFTTGLMILNGHVGYLPLIIFGILFYIAGVLGSSPPLVIRWRWILLSALICLGMAVSPIYRLYEELLLFPSHTHRLLEGGGGIDLWALFIKPFYPTGLSEMIRLNLHRGVRIPFFGAPFACLAFLGVLRRGWENRHAKAFAAAFMCCAACTFLPPDKITGVLSSTSYFRDPFVLFGILLGGFALNHISLSQSKKTKILIWTVGMIQVVVLMGGSGPFWYRQVTNSFMVSKLRLYSLLEPSGFIQTLKEYSSRQPGRFYFAPEFDRFTREANMIPRGLFINMLAYHEMPLVNGIFRGISVDALHPSAILPYGQILGQKTLVNDKASLDVLGIRYIIALENEKVSSSLILEKTLGTPDGRKVRIWMNHDAWPEAVFLNPKAREVNLPLKEKCEHDRFLCKDFSLVPSFRLPKDTIHLVQHHGDLSLQLPPAPFPRLLWISQMFRKGWVATTKGQRLEVFPLFEHTIGISVPPNVNEINLKFKPTARRLTTFFSEGSLFSSILILIGLYWRQRVSKNIKIV